MISRESGRCSRRVRWSTPGRGAERLVERHSRHTTGRQTKAMDKDEAFRNILRKLRGGRLEDVADKLMALFREPEWWEEEFDAHFVTRRSLEAFQDAETRDAIKAFISALLTRAQHEERQKLLRDIERLGETFFTSGERPEEPSSARQLYAFLLHALRQQYGLPQVQPGSV
jgi:hypothetical protein